MRLSASFAKAFLIAAIVFLPIGFLLGSAYSGSSSGTIIPTQGDTGPAARVQVSLDDDPSLGSANAPVTIIEFSDFQCPFCRRHFSATFPDLKKNYIDTGKVRYVYRDYPLSFHPGAEPSAQIAECAEEQNKFWEVHDKIFEKQNEQGTGTVTYTAEDIFTWISSIQGLDVNKVRTCYAANKYKSEVAKDLADGTAYGVSGTPSFFIGSPAKGYIILVGAQPLSVFEQAIAAELK